MDEDDYIDEVALGSYFMLRMEEEREASKRNVLFCCYATYGVFITLYFSTCWWYQYERRKVAGNLFRFLIGELMPVKGFVQGMSD